MTVLFCFCKDYCDKTECIDIEDYITLAKMVHKNESSYEIFGI